MNTQPLTVPPNTPLKSHSSESAHSIVDQSVPNSPGGSGNFAIVFSEGEEEEGEEEREGEREASCDTDELVSSQMSKQIQKVTNFLKMDRLRRTKMPKL